MLPGTGKPTITIANNTIEEAEKLHVAIPPSNWCVTKEDLSCFRKLVHRSWHQGHIKRNVADYAQIPTPEEAVKRHNDPLVGPSMYQVNDHFIMPVTAEAGGMSWALMCCIQAAIKESRWRCQRGEQLLEGESWALKRYKALKQKSGVGDDKESVRSWLQTNCIGSRECDTFITHGWAEGVFEFCDKVLGSLPSSSRNLWICFFANPQNLGVLLKKLVSGEVDQSPFALALQTCSLVLVVPNGAQSIYRRIWCVYEAYKAYHASKRAIKPIQMTVARAVRKQTLCITSIKLMAAFTLMMFVAFFVVGVASYHCDGIVGEFGGFHTWYENSIMHVELFYVVVCVPYVTIKAVGGPLIPRINVVVAFIIRNGTAANRINHCMLRLSQCMFPLFTIAMLFAAGLTLAKPVFLFGCMGPNQHAQLACRTGLGRDEWMSKDTVEPYSALFFFFPLLTWGCFREVWVQLAEQGKTQLGLPCGDTVRNAESSCQEDKERILEKITDDIDDVNQTVRILQQDGCCNVELHEAANVGVDTSGALTEAGCCMRTMQKFIWAAIALGLLMDYRVTLCKDTKDTTPIAIVTINYLTILFVVVVSWVVPCFSWWLHVSQSCSCREVTVHRRFAGYSLFVGAVLTCTSLLVVEGLWGTLHSYRYGTASAIDTGGKQLFCYDVVTLIFSVRASMKAIAGPTSQWSRSVTNRVRQISLRNLQRLGRRQQLGSGETNNLPGHAELLQAQAPEP